MFNSSLSPTAPVAPGAAKRVFHRRFGCFRLELAPLVGAATLLGACSLLIEVEDEVDDRKTDNAILPRQEDAGVDQGPEEQEPPLDAAVERTARDAGVDGGVDEPGPPFDLAFIENSEESHAVVRLVSAELALGDAASEVSPPWRRTLEPAGLEGDVLDFAWAPGGQRIAVRYATNEGARLAFFTAPGWQELPLEDPLDPAVLSQLSATANYRWSPDGRALAAEFAGAGAPYVAGYSIEDTAAHGLAPVAFSGPIETMHWPSSTTLYVIQADLGAPELLSLSVATGAFGVPQSVRADGLLLPLELRPVPSGLIGASSNIGNFLFFWPESLDPDGNTAFLPASYLSGGKRFVAEREDSGMALYPIGNIARPLDTLPGCSVVLAWQEGPDPRSLDGSRIACLSAPAVAAATLTLFRYDSGGVRTAIPLEDEALRADFAADLGWGAHAWAFSPSGDWLALATTAHEALIDLRGGTPAYQIAEAAPGNAARGFSPSGAYLLQQRGQTVVFTVLAAADDVPPLDFELPDAFNQLGACESVPSLANWCGAPDAAHRAGARWSQGSDVAALLATGGGLVVLKAEEDTVGLMYRSVSTCGANCIGQYEFGL